MCLSSASAKGSFACGHPIHTISSSATFQAFRSNDIQCCFQASLALFASSFLGFRTLGHLSVTHFQDENLNIAESSRVLPIRHHPYKMVAFCKMYYPCRPTRMFRLVLSLLLDAVGIARCSLLQAFHKPFGKNMPNLSNFDNGEVRRADSRIVLGQSPQKCPRFYHAHVRQITDLRILRFTHLCDVLTCEG